MSTNKVEKNVTVNQEQAVARFRLWDFIGDVKAEFSKITWTERDELVVYARIVVVATFFLGLGIYFADLIIQGWLSGMSAIFRLIGG